MLVCTGSLFRASLTISRHGAIEAINLHLQKSPRAELCGRSHLGESHDIDFAAKLFLLLLTIEAEAFIRCVGYAKRGVTGDCCLSQNEDRGHFLD